MCPLNMLFPKVGTSEQPIQYNTGSFNENLNALLNNVIQVDASTLLFYISLNRYLIFVAGARGCRVAECQSFYTEQNLQAKFYPKEIV